MESESDRKLVERLITLLAIEIEGLYRHESDFKIITVQLGNVRKLLSLARKGLAAERLAKALQGMLETHRVDGSKEYPFGGPSVRGDCLEARKKAVSALAAYQEAIKE